MYDLLSLPRPARVAFTKLGVVSDGRVGMLCNELMFVTKINVIVLGWVCWLDYLLSSFRMGGWALQVVELETIIDTKCCVRCITKISKIKFI